MSTIPMTVSRSGVVAVATSMGFLVSVWGERQMLRAASAGVVGLAIIYVSSPTLLGWIGVGILTFMYVAGISTGHKIRRTAPDDTTRHLGQVLAAGFVTLFFIDGLFFQIYVGTTFLYISAVGAIYRMMHTQGVRPEVEALAQERALLSRRHAAKARPRWWSIALADDLPALFEERS